MRSRPCWLGLQQPIQRAERTAFFLSINSCCQPPNTKSFQAMVRGLILWTCHLSRFCTAQGGLCPTPAFPSLTLSTGELSFTPRRRDRQRGYVAVLSPNSPYSCPTLSPFRLVLQSPLHPRKTSDNREVSMRWHSQVSLELGTHFSLPLLQ